MDPLTLILASCAVLFCVGLAVSSVRAKRSNKYPPGPSGIPIFGNLKQVWCSKPYLPLTEIARKYGDVYSLKLGTQRVVVLNSIETAKEALLSKGKSVGGRPRFNTINTLHGGEKKFLFNPICDSMVKLTRKSIVTNIRERGNSMEDIVEGEMQKLTAILFGNGEKQRIVDMRAMLHNSGVNIALGYGFGETLELNDPHLQSWKNDLEEYRELLNWFRLDNFLPFSKLYMREYRNRVKIFRARNVLLFEKSLQLSRQKIMNGTDVPKSLAGLLVETLGENNNLSDDDSAIMTILRDVMFGASDGTFQPLIWALCYILQYPWLQDKLQMEIDNVVGPYRPPVLDDKTNMPYTEAVIREILRYSEITALGIPRRTVEDLTVGAYTIPKDTVVIVNVHQIHRDLKHWKNPHDFDPTRFLTSEGKLRPSNELSYLPFSIGVRSCVGQNLARNAQFLLFSRFFQIFNISAPEGQTLPDMMNDGGSFNPEVKPFKVVIERRIDISREE